MKVLLTSAGRRVSLLENFRRAATALAGAKAAVYAVDLDPSKSAACQRADGHATVPRAADPLYVERLLELCTAWKIDVVVPTIDTELVPLALARETFASHGITVAVSSPELCRTFHSKRETAKFFTSKGVDTPAIIDDLEHAEFPLFAKLDDSSRSVGAGPVASFDAAVALRAKNPAYVFQPLVTGVEYTVDAFVDRRGEVLGVVPRRRLEVRDGEVSKGLAVKDPRIIDAVRDLCARTTGAYGTMTVQLFQRADGSLSFIEVNPRFGGGYPLTMHAGADFALYLLMDVRGEAMRYDDSWHDGTMMLRYDAEVIVRGHRL
jgi:carbamoyl-phosphate synthase large subunit